MPNRPPFVETRNARQRLWIEELRNLMLADPVLVNHEPLLDGVFLYSHSFPVRQRQHRDLRHWVDTRRHLVAFRDESSGKFSLVSFGVLDWRRNEHSAFFDEVVIEIDLYAQTSRLNGEAFSIHIVSPGIDEPVRYQNLFVFRGPSTIDCTNVQVGDLIERFPRQVENILYQVGFIADVILSEEAQ